ncbi:hypothetical protein Metbo_2162 [Methanobacterium lacus]|uniref:Uncharacterized protein n=1 Tax=Methanobacterium lacus (strain AL-21) TaxID=877455 RepID=F0TCB0_METLA|nr:hypothetical protein [Methanobacterium lacus]ADZ10377.1 hypothetical protein Metbo_2162 [Methanobacterium lacus]
MKVDSQKCVLCDNAVTSPEEGWKFTNFNICHDCIERIFKDMSFVRGGDDE